MENFNMSSEKIVFRETITFFVLPTVSNFLFVFEQAAGSRFSMETCLKILCHSTVKPVKEGHQKKI